MRAKPAVTSTEIELIIIRLVPTPRLPRPPAWRKDWEIKVRLKDGTWLKTTFLASAAPSSEAVLQAWRERRGIFIKQKVK